ncbi:MAG: hypothetical protein AB1513_11005 [Pseudomonadota bacterium]
MMRNKTLVLLVLFGVAGLAQAEFRIGMTETQINEEADRQLNQSRAGRSLKEIVQEAYDAQLDMTTVTTALVRAGADMELVVNAVIKVGISPELVVSAAVKAGADRDAAVRVAIAAGADPSSLTTATAAGHEHK